MSLNSLISNGGVIAVAGVMSGNLAPDLDSDPRIVKLRDGQDLPLNTRAVLFTRFIGHSYFEKLTAEGRKRHLTLFPVWGTGLINNKLREILEKPRLVKKVVEQPKVEIKEEPKDDGGFLINGIHPDDMYSVQPETKQQEEVVAMAKRNIRGVVTQFVKENTDFNVKYSKQIQDLLALSKKKGFNFSKSSLASAYYNLKARNKKVEPVKTTNKVLLQTFDDAIAGLALVRETLATMERENIELKEKLSNLKKLVE